MPRIFLALVLLLFIPAALAATENFKVFIAALTPTTLVPASDYVVGFRPGGGDSTIRFQLGSAALENTSSVIADNGAGALTIGAGQVSNAMLANSTMTLAGHSVSLGGTQAFACGDLSNAGTACTAVAPANTTATASNFFTAYTAATGAFTKAQPACGDLSNGATGCSTVVGTAATHAASDFEVPLTFSTGLTRTVNTVTVNTSQDIATLSNLTANGFVKTSGGVGTLGIDTSTYLTGNQSITLSSDVTGSGTTAITTTIANNAVTNAKAAQGGANTMKGNWTSGTANEADNSMPSCSDSGGNHLNYVSGTGITCGTTSSVAGTVTSVGTNNGLTGGTITSTGTLGLASIATNGALCNNTGSSNPPTTANCTVTGTGNMVLATSPSITTPTLAGPTFSTYVASTNGTANTGTSYALNLDNGATQVITITGAVTVTLTRTSATSSRVKFLQDGSGHVYSITGCKWAGATAIVYSTAASAYDIISIWYDGTNYNCMGGAGFG